jgi:hypothetical protein
MSTPTSTRIQELEGLEWDQERTIMKFTHEIKNEREYMRCEYEYGAFKKMEMMLWPG